MGAYAPVKKNPSAFAVLEGQQRRWDRKVSVLAILLLGTLFAQTEPLLLSDFLSLQHTSLVTPQSTSPAVPVLNSSIFSPVPSPSPRPITAFSTFDFLTPPPSRKPLPQVPATAVDFLQPRPPLGIQVVINLSRQRLTLFRYKQVLLESPISSGRASHPTTVGNFEVVQKDLHHFSTLYGQFVTRSGAVIGGGSSRRVPRGCRFKPAPMKYFLRFNGAEGLHAGALPGHAASHGCVRLPINKAVAIFKSVGVGTPVIVTGSAPRGQRIRQAKTRNSELARATNLISSPSSQKKHGWPFLLLSQKKR